MPLSRDMRIRQKAILTFIGKTGGRCGYACVSYGRRPYAAYCRRTDPLRKSADTPAAFVRWGTRPYQETYTTTLGEAAEAVKKYGIKPPSVFIVGNVVNLREQLRWYDNKPLFGKHVVITRSRTQASRLTEVLEDLGAFCTEIPSIKIESPDDGWASIDQGIEKLAEYNWIVFTSQNGVDAFLRGSMKRI